MRSILPNSSFIEIETKKLASPELAWINRKVAKEADYLKHAYCIPAPDDCPSAYLSKSKIYYGERYGGDGVGNNGGGVRCGLDEHVQIKGIGKNLLAPEVDADFWHTHGGASLEEGIREAIWGEVCNIALPHGASRVLALITTGTQVPYRGIAEDRFARRALILREPELRPAHYMRAIYFKPSKEFLDKYPCDAERTKEAVRAFAKGLASVFGDEGNDPNDWTYIKICINEMYKRFATQMAASHAKRIMHGSLGPSNLCIDGKWIDYGTISTLSDYGRVSLGSADLPDLWLEYSKIPSTLQDIFFYLGKYLFPNENLVGVIAQEAHAVYNETYAKRSMIEFLKLTGIPEKCLSKIEGRILERMYRCMKAVISRGNSEPFKLAPTQVWEMPPKMGRFHLNTILRKSALCATKMEMLKTLETELGDDALRTEFSECYWELRKAYASTSDVVFHSQANKAFFIFNAIRVNTIFPELYRTNMEHSLPQLLQNNGSIEAFIEKTVVKAKTLFSEPACDRIDISAWFDHLIEVDKRQGILKNGALVSLSDTLNEIHDGVMSPAEKEMAIKL